MTYCLISYTSEHFQDGKNENILVEKNFLPMMQLLYFKNLEAKLKVAMLSFSPKIVSIHHIGNICNSQDYKTRKV